MTGNPQLFPIQSPRLETLAGEFATIVADPPWPIKRTMSQEPGIAFEKRTLPNVSVPLTYPILSIPEITALRPPAAPNAHLYLWTVNAHLADAYAIARAWKFRPVTLLVWIKAPMGLGPGGTFCNTTEYLLFARRGTLKAKRRLDSTWFAYPRGRHSEKPEAFQTLIESVSPGPYLEM
ncbi:MAG: hypothetical protein EHM33_21825, partial [Chloroflexi bacterium]